MRASTTWLTPTGASEFGDRDLRSHHDSLACRAHDALRCYNAAEEEDRWR
jgi:hypothetical protein